MTGVQTCALPISTRLYRNAAGVPGIRVRLRGGEAAGALIRLEYPDGLGPIREVHYGSGYWSQDGGVVVLGRRAGAPPKAVVVKWPGGRTSRVAIGPAGREVVVQRP